MDLALFIEIVVYIFFLIFVAFLCKQGRKDDWRVLLTACLYAIGFELCGIYFAGTYTYQSYLVGWGGLPLYIPLMRSLLLYHTYALITKHEPILVENTTSLLRGTRRYLALKWAVLGACYVLSYDLVIDVIAVRNGLWTRHLLPDQAWFGVAYGNFFGWFIVTMCFLYFMLLWKHKYFSFGKSFFAALFAQFLLLQGSLFLTKHWSIGVDHAASPYFWIQIGATILGLVFFLFSPKKSEDQTKGVVVGREWLWKIADWFFAAVHVFSIGVVVAGNYAPELVSLSFLLGGIYLFYLIRMETWYY